MIIGFPVVFQHLFQKVRPAIFTSLSLQIDSGVKMMPDLINAQKALFRLETLDILVRVNFTLTIWYSSIIYQFTYLPILNYYFFGPYPQGYCVWGCLFIVMT
jgi:hypothetical protein